MEYATHSGRRMKRDLQEIPEFRNFLKREGIDFATWEARQRLAVGPDATSEVLTLAWRKVHLNRNR